MSGTFLSLCIVSSRSTNAHARFHQLTRGEPEAHPDAKLGNHEGSRTVASLYDLIQANPEKHVNPIGEWNTSHIIAKNNHVEHWLNGRDCALIQLSIHIILIDKNASVPYIDTAPTNTPEKAPAAAIIAVETPIIQPCNLLLTASENKVIMVA